MVWGSSLTKTGAGHCSIAFKDSVGFHYFSHYPNSIVGTIDTFLLNFNSLQSFDKEILGIQRSNPNLILQGNYDGLYVIEKQNNEWKLRNKIRGFDISSKFFEMVDTNQILVNHEYKGVLKININQ